MNEELIIDPSIPVIIPVIDEFDDFGDHCIF